MMNCLINPSIARRNHMRKPSMRNPSMRNPMRNPSMSMRNHLMRNHLGIMTNNMSAVVNLLMSLLTVSGDDVLALLNVGGVHNGLAYLLGDLAGVLLGMLVALLGFIVMAFGSSGVSNAIRLSL